MVEGKREVTIDAGETEKEAGKQHDGEEKRVSGGGEEARGKPAQSPHHPCAAFVLVMHGSHFDVCSPLCLLR